MLTHQHQLLALLYRNFHLQLRRLHYFSLYILIAVFNVVVYSQIRQSVIKIKYIVGLSVVTLSLQVALNLVVSLVRDKENKFRVVY